MSPRFLLDTDICIHIHRQRPAKVLARFSKTTPGDAAISVITWGELRCGAEKNSQRDAVLDMLDELAALAPVLPMPEAAGAAYGTIRSALEKRGESLAFHWHDACAMK